MILLDDEHSGRVKSARFDTLHSCIAQLMRKPANPPSVATPDDIARDESLVMRCVRGDAGAWDELYDACHHPLQVAIKSLLGVHGQNHELVEEIAARVWYHVARNDGASLAGFDAQRRCRLTTYLAAIARNQVRSYWRSESRRRKREKIAARQEQDGADPAMQYGLPQLKELCESLTPREREFLAWSMGPVSESEAGKQFQATAAQWRYRVRGKIRDYLADRDR